MTETVESEVPLENSVPGVPLTSILLTEQLQRRSSRPAKYETENNALVALATALADSPGTILQTLADKVLEVLQAGSAGLSLVTKDQKRFYWAAIAGAWQAHLGGGTPRNFGPCGDVLDHNVPMLFTRWDLRYPYLGTATPLAEEGLLVPFHVNGKAVGTIWAIIHDKSRGFDAEDLRLLESMGRFASAAYQAVGSIENLRLEVAARQKAESEVRELAKGLETQVCVRTSQLERKTRDLLDSNAALEREIAERKRAEDARRLSEEALDKARAEVTQVARITTLGTLAASIAHEINQPLSGIVTNASTCVRMLTAEPANVQGGLETAKRTIRDANRAAEVIARLRALFNKKGPALERVDLNEIAAEAVALWLNRLQSNQMTVRTEFASDLLPVSGDRIQLQQVILNLFANASDAMSEVEGEARQLVIKTQPEEGGGVRLNVKDTGVGFNPADAERLFEMFYTTKDNGMGIGLSVSRGIIEAHEGRLWAAPNDGPGATFSFSIPAYPGLGCLPVSNHTRTH